MEREVDRDLDMGRKKTFDDVESFLADLDAHAAADTRRDSAVNDE